MLAPFTLVFSLFLKLVKTLLWAIWKNKNYISPIHNYRTQKCEKGQYANLLLNFLLLSVLKAVVLLNIYFV